MSNNHLISQDIGNLKGFSTDSAFTRPPNVAEIATNIQRAPDETLQLRRGYQCQAAQIGGMGIGTVDNPAIDHISTVTIGKDGFAYSKLTKQIYFYYDGQVTGLIQNISNANPAEVQSDLHGLMTGAQIIIRNVNGMTNLNNFTFTITVIDANNFTLNGIDSTLYSAYVSGGYWSISFADQRYLTFSIFTDPRYIYNNAGQSITCDIIVNRAAQINGNQVGVNTINVQFGHQLVATDVVQFYTSTDVLQTLTLTSVTATSITFAGPPVSVNNGIYINQYFDILFGKGFDTASPYSIATFISTITNPVTGIYGLQVAINGNNNLPAAFLQIVEPTIIDNNITFIIDYWYWIQINYTSINAPLPGSGNITYQNSPDFEIASMDVVDNVLYIANGWDYPQKYDGQTIYRTGMPLGVRPNATDNTTFISQPFIMTNVYQYAITYEQIDNFGHIVEGEISEIWNHTVVAATSAINVIITNLQTTLGSNWNTNGALAVGGTSSVYGPDINGFYYDLVNINAGSTLKIGDSAYYGDITCAVMTGGALADTITLPVMAGHGVLPGDTIYFIDSGNVERQRIVASVTSTTITIHGAPVSIDPSIDATHSNILDYKVSLVFGDVAIVNGAQSNVNNIIVEVGHSIELGDVVEFIDSENNLQRRNVTFEAANNITISGIPVSVTNLSIIYSINQIPGQINLQRLNANPATLSNGATGNISNAISNNLRINIYRTLNGVSFGTNGELYLVASIPNDSSGAAFQTYIDGLPDTEVNQIRTFDDPDLPPNPPPISKYVKAFGNQLFYAGGERGNAQYSDYVFFSDGNEPEVVPLATNSFIVPNKDDDITGIGVSGSTLVTTKNKSLWAATGNFLSGQINVVQIAPGTNIGCVAHASIASVGTIMLFLHTNGVYAITENQLFPTDENGNPIALSRPIQLLFRQTNYLPQTKYVLKRATAINYTKDLQYLLFLPCEDVQSTIRTANLNSIVLAYDYENKNWFDWDNINAAGGMVVIDDDLYFQERRYSAVNGNTANLYKQHRFYRLVDHADHAGPQYCEWRSSWADLRQPEVRKKFSRCILLMDRLSDLLQYNNPIMNFSSYLNRITDLPNTIVNVTTVDNVRNSAWSTSPWGWGVWSGYQDTFVAVNLKQGTVAKSIQVGFKIQGINMDIRLAGFQLEIIPENRKTVIR